MIGEGQGGGVWIISDVLNEDTSMLLERATYNVGDATQSLKPCG